MKGNTGRDVGLDYAGDDVNTGSLRGDDAVDTSGAGHLCDTCDAVLHIVFGHEHQVRQLIDDDNDVAKLCGNLDVILSWNTDFLIHLDGKTFAFVKRQFRLIGLGRLLTSAGIETSDVAGADLGKNLVPLFHFVHHPLEGENDFLGIMHHRRGEVGEAVVNLQLDHLGVDHDEAKFLRCKAE